MDNENLPEFAPFAPIDDAGFSEQVAARTARMSRRRLIQRIVMGIMITFAAAPLRDYGMALSALAMTEIIPVAPSLVSAALTPLNSVGAVLGAVLFCVRLFYRRIFR